MPLDKHQSLLSDEKRIGLYLYLDCRGLDAIAKPSTMTSTLVNERLAIETLISEFNIRATFYGLRIVKGKHWKTAFRTYYWLFKW